MNRTSAPHRASYVCISRYKDDGQRGKLARLFEDTKLLYYFVNKLFKVNT